MRHQHNELPDHFPLPPIRIVDREQWLVEFCSGKDVLHLGCADALYTEARLQDLSRLLHYRLTEVAHYLVGLDNAHEELEKLAARWPQWELVLGDVEHLEAVKLDRQFDVVLAGELVEHLLNVGLFLTSVRHHLKPGVGRLVITTPNHFGTRRFSHLLRGAEKVHPDHTCYYSYHTLKHTVERCGYELCFTLGYSSPVESAVKQCIYVLVESLPQSLFSAHACEGLICVAAPR